MCFSLKQFSDSFNFKETYFLQRSPSNQNIEEQTSDKEVNEDQMTEKGKEQSIDENDSIL